MSTPTYVVERVGDSYEVRPQTHGRKEPALCAIGGSALLLMGLSKRGFLGTALAAVGGSLLYRSFTGCDPLAKLAAYLPSFGRRFDSGPSFQHDQHGSTQQPEDAVDESVMESFPASDAPAHTRSTADV